MNLDLIVYAAFVVALTACVYVIADKRYGVWVVAVMGLMWFGALTAGFFLEGRPRPVALLTNDVEVLAYRLAEGEHIDLFVLDGEARFYRMPWSLPAAKRLLDARQKAGEEGRVILKDRRDRRTGEWVFHPEPPQPMPPKIN